MNCNAKCKHCFIWNELNKHKNELTLEEIEKTSKSMGNIFFLFLTGGEPFMRDDIDKIVEIYYKNNNAVNLNIPTNGLLTDRIYAKCKSILEKCRDLSFNLSISIDDFEKFHDLNRGVKGTYKKAIATYLKLLPLKQKYKNFSVNIVGVITAENQGRILKIIEHFKNQFGPDVFHVNFIRGKPRQAELANVDPRIFEQTCEVQKKPEFRLSTNFTQFKRPLRYNMNRIRSTIITKTAKNNRYMFPCYAGMVSGVMMSEGTVYPCELLDNKMGNIRDYNYNFPKLWKSKAAKEVVSMIKRTKCFCTHECFWTANIVFNPKLLMKVFTGRNIK